MNQLLIVLFNIIDSMACLLIAVIVIILLCICRSPSSHEIIIPDLFLSNEDRKSITEMASVCNCTKTLLTGLSRIMVDHRINLVKLQISLQPLMS